MMTASFGALTKTYLHTEEHRMTDCICTCSNKEERCCKKRLIDIQSITDGISQQAKSGR